MRMGFSLALKLLKSNTIPINNGIGLDRKG